MKTDHGIIFNNGCINKLPMALDKINYYKRGDDEFKDHANNSINRPFYSELWNKMMPCVVEEASPLVSNNCSASCSVRILRRQPYT